MKVGNRVCVMPDFAFPLWYPAANEVGTIDRIDEHDGIDRIVGVRVLFGNGAKYWFFEEDLVLVQEEP